MNKMRKCPICGSNRRKNIFTQKYSSHFNHQIVVCSDCNFIFVGNIPSEKYYKEYYKNQSKYEGVRNHEVHEDETVKELLHFAKDKLLKKSEILEIGCSTGYLLSVFKKNGYKNLIGLEPAPGCKKIAKEKYGLNVKTGDLETFATSKKYDFIILSMVLEHLTDVKGSINKIRSLLKDNGYLYINVPNTSNFYLNVVEPFGEFSTEHINFFTESSLYFLMRDFTNLAIKSNDNVLHSFWIKGDAGVRSIEKYIKISGDMLRNIKRTIDSLDRKVIVWGAGALSQRLLSTINIRDKILFFVDSNQNLWDVKLDGLSVCSPNTIKDYKDVPVLVCSYNFSDEILKSIKNRGFSNKVLTFNVKQ